MRCRAVRNRLSEYLDGDLPTLEQAELTRHLETCAACRAEAAAWQRAEAALQVLAVPEPVPDLVHDLRRRLTAPSRRSLPWAWAGAGALLAAVALLCCLWGRPSARPGKPAPAARTHVAGLPQPVRVPAIVSPAAPVVPESGESLPRVTPVRKRVRRQPEAPVHAPVPSVEDGSATPEVQPELAPPELALLVAEPVEAASDPAGVILLLGEPPAEPPLSSCYLQVSLPDGSGSEAEQVVERDAAGQPRAVQIAYRTISSQTRELN